MNMTKTSDSSGFAEEQTKNQAELVLPQYWLLKVAPDGRFVIPAAVRAGMELGEEGNVTAYLHEGELRIISPRAALRRAQTALAPYKGEGSAVDELIAERRAAAERGD